MKIDKSDFYPATPGANCDPDFKPEEQASENHLTADNLAASAPEAETTQEAESNRYDGPTPDENFKGCHKEIDIVSNILSWVLVPLLVPVYATILILWLSPLASLPLMAKCVFISIVALCSAFIPMGLVVLLKRFGLVDDLGLNGRKERLIPYLISICSFVAIAWLFHSKGMPAWVNLFYMGGALAGLINLLVNFRWKISAHAAATAGVVALLLVIAELNLTTPKIVVWTVIAVILCGLLGSARIWLGRHTPAQVICGSAVGFLSVYLIQLIR